MEYPKLRHGVEALPVEHQGKRMIMLRDSLGITEDVLLMPVTVAQLLVNMNGESSLRDLQAHYMRATGSLLYLEELQGIVKKLDDHLFLESEKFIKLVAEEVSRFQNDPVRRASFAGKSYPDDPAQLREHLERFFPAENGGPGIPKAGQSGRDLAGLVAPHIDIRAGGACYAHAYKALCEASAPDTWVILGTGHEPVDNFFTLTVKDFETPLGTVSCDREYCKELLEKAPVDLMASELSHRREHSVEFQAVFLSRFQPGARIVPVLCSFSIDDWESHRDIIDGTAEVMRRIADSSQRPVGFMASVDLAHIGPRYGDRFHPSSADVTEHMASDRALLELLERCSPDELFGKIRRERNRRRICGAAPLYVLTKILEGRVEGKLLHHSHTTVDQSHSFVTFASMVFYRSGKGGD